MTPPTTDTSREAVKLAWDIGMGSVDGYDLDASRPEYKSAVALHAVALSLLAERDALQKELKWRKKESEDYREQLIQSEKRCEILQAQLDVSVARQKEMRDQLAAARNEALEEVGDELCRVCNGYAAEDNMTAATAICDAAMCVRALKPTPATSQRCAECDCENGGSDCTWISTPAPRDGDMTSQATPITFTYKNYRGEVATRTTVPKAIWFGTTEWHPEPGWLMTAYDLEKAADRDFALADCSFAPRETTLQEAEL